MAPKIVPNYPAILLASKSKIIANLDYMTYRTRIASIDIIHTYVLISWGK